MLFNVFLHKVFVIDKPGKLFKGTTDVISSCSLVKGIYHRFTTVPKDAEYVIVFLSPKEINSVNLFLSLAATKFLN